MKKLPQKAKVFFFTVYFCILHYIISHFLFVYVFKRFARHFLIDRLVLEVYFFACYVFTIWMVMWVTRVSAQNRLDFDITYYVNKKNKRKVFLILVAVATVSRLSIAFNVDYFRDIYGRITPLATYLTLFFLVIRYYKNNRELKFVSLKDKYNTNETVIEPKKKSVLQKKPLQPVISSGDRFYELAQAHYGSARWQSDLEKNAHNAYSADKHTSEIEHKFSGLWIGGGFFHDKEGNLCSIAPPGTGKGAALIIPNLLWKRDYKHSFVVFDPKGTNACITARFQKDQGKKVIIIDPMNLQALNNAKHGIPASSFNALDFIKDDVFNGASQIANLLLPDDNKGEKYWNQEARNLLKLIICFIVQNPAFKEEEKNLVKLYKIMVKGDFITLFTDILTTDEIDQDTKDIAIGYVNLLNTSEKQFGSIRAIASAAVQWLGNPAIQNSIKSSNFYPEELEKGNVAVYICQPIQNKEGFSSFSRLVIGFCLRANSMPSPVTKAWVYYLLDEFPTMGIFPEVIEALAYAREYRMRIWIFSPSLSMLDTIYTVDGRNSILGSARVLQVFGATDKITQDFISHRIGNTTALTITETHSKGESISEGSSSGVSSGGGAGGASFSSQRGHNHGSSSNVGYSENTVYHSRPLLAPEEVQNEPSIITIADWGPMRLNRFQYWQRHDTSNESINLYQGIFHDGRADANPNFSAMQEY